MLKGVVENDDKAWKEFYLFYKPLTGIVMSKTPVSKKPNTVLK